MVVPGTKRYLSRSFSESASAHTTCLTFARVHPTWNLPRKPISRANSTVEVSGIAVQPRVYSRFLSAPAGTESIGYLGCNMKFACEVRDRRCHCKIERYDM